MKTIAVIPARIASTRFPEKMLKPLGGKPLIVRTFQAVKNTQLFDQVWVATDSTIIQELIENEGGSVFMSTKPHESGSDRIAEAVAEQTTDIVINIQGDEPFVSKKILSQLIEVFRQDTNQQVDVASVMIPLHSPHDINDPNQVKVVIDTNQFALYFSRAPIPFNRDLEHKTNYFKHLGVYAFRKKALMDFTQMEKGSLEQIEKLEQLRYLENGRKIKMILTENAGIGIDTAEDLAKAEKLWQTLHQK